MGSVDRHAAVHADQLPGDVARAFAGQEHPHRRDLLRLGPAAERDAIERALVLASPRRLVGRDRADTPRSAAAWDTTPPDLRSRRQQNKEIFVQPMSS